VTASPSRAPDWGLGHYERTAAQLMPAAHVVVERAAPASGEHVVDVGCGTGNAALLAAERGASVTGVDPAPRLLEVARERAALRDLDVAFEPGDAAALPVADGHADLVLSVFGIIFAPDPPAAVAEVARVTAPRGRIVLSAWIPGGAISRAVRTVREMVTRALGAQPSAPPFAWHEPHALRDLSATHGFDVTTEDHRIAFTARSPADFAEAEAVNHPLAVAGRAVLEPRGEVGELEGRLLEIYEAANEDPAAFRITSRYVVATARRRR
jgi:SAM-dependent methyltransferase